MSAVTSPPEFSWPEFDRWQAAFAAAERFPARWDGLHAAPPSGAPGSAAYRHRKLVLFFEWLDLLAKRSTALAHYANRGIRARVARQDTGSPCPACDPFHAREVGPRLDAVPPFHPGCRCVLVAIPAVAAVARPHRDLPLRPRARRGRRSGASG